MIICLIIALLTTFLYINLTVAEIVNAKINHSTVASNNNQIGVIYALIKYVLILIMSIFWGVIIHHYLP